MKTSSQGISGGHPKIVGSGGGKQAKLTCSARVWVNFEISSGTDFPVSFIAEFRDKPFGFSV